jgi:NAD(P)-dependent dehydrogenase (short-subunit alcohol dehydrogenase family)
VNRLAQESGGGSPAPHISVCPVLEFAGKPKRERIVGVLDGKVAIVTGASSGIGRAAARLFADEGAKVIVSARRQDELDRLVSEIAGGGGTAMAYAGDIRDEACACALVDLAVREFGGLDIAFNNAGTLAR